jgi:fatty acid desaturase
VGETRKAQKSKVALALFMLAVLLGGSVVIAIASAGIEFMVVILIIVGIVILLFVGSRYKKR